MIDNDTSDFAEMPWAALPYVERGTKSKLSTKFKVEGIPTLVVLDKDGSIITTKGRAEVSSSTSRETFPFRPKSIQELLGTSFQSKAGEITQAELSGKFLGLYFSAHWCPPCRNFTPKLASFYEARKQQGKDDFEIIFFSSDRDVASFNEYYESMPWLAAPFGDARIEALSNRFQVEGIPTLVIIDSDGKVITTGATSSVMVTIVSIFSTVH